MSFDIPKEPSQSEIRTVQIGTTKEEGGTRTSVVTIGGATALPFHAFEGEMHHPPIIAMEVFDSVPGRFPQALLDIYGDVIDKPGEMAKRCVDDFGADLISIRLDGTHPDKGDKSGILFAYFTSPLVVASNSIRNIPSNVVFSLCSFALR